METEVKIDIPKATFCQANNHLDTDLQAYGFSMFDRRVLKK